MMKEKSRPVEKAVDISEKGKDEEGNVTSLNRRLYMQMVAFGDCNNTDVAIAALQQSGIDCVLYAEVNDPNGIGLLTFSEDPAHFVTAVRPVLNSEPFASMTPKLEFSMLGRTYSIGYEKDLEYVLLRKPAERVTNEAWPWAVWYPLKRKGAFEKLTNDEQLTILREHGGIGRAYGGSGHGLDVRLSCHGLDKHDNDFVTGLVGDNLTGLSKIVQRMRKTVQTSIYLERLGPFFVGRAIYQHLNQ